MSTDRGVSRWKKRLYCPHMIRRACVNYTLLSQSLKYLNNLTLFLLCRAVFRFSNPKGKGGGQIVKRRGGRRD